MSSVLSSDVFTLSAWFPMCALSVISCVVVMPNDFHNERACSCWVEFDLQMQCISCASWTSFMAWAISAFDTPFSFTVHMISSMNCILRLSLVRRLEYAIMPIGLAVSSTCCGGGGWNRCCWYDMLCCVCS